MDKQALIEKIQTLGGLTNDEKSALLELLRSHKKYGLVWEDKPEDVEERLRDELPVLTEVKERALISDAPDAPNHILIEGDNLEALTALSYTHEGKVDVIYIDPPYNTGNKDFVYNDKFVDSEDDYRHSKWLSFMERRLRIARRLLSDRGVIFISIDDNEQAQLKLLCDEVFKNLIFSGYLIWRKKSGGGQTERYFVTEHEYVLVYSNKLFEWKDPTEAHSIANYKYSDGKGHYNIIALTKWGSSAHKEDRPTMYFPILDPTGEDYYPIAPDLKPGRWRVGRKRMAELIKNGDVEWRDGKPFEKVYFSPESIKLKVFKARSILYSIGETGDGTKMLTEILGSKDKFENPKPLALCKDLISHNDSKIILDFFAGSGTTLHATMQLNAEDGGHRKCILVTNNENGICENVTYERNKRVIQGYITPKGEDVPGLTANTLRYYKTDFISRNRTQRNMHALVEAATDLLCIKEDLYEEQTHFGQYKTHPKVLRYFAKGNKRMLVLYRDEYTEEVAAEIERIHLPQGEKIKVYIFSPDRYAYDDMFQDVAEKVTLVALPAAIYDAYKKVLPKRREKLLELQTDHNEANEEGGEQ